MKNKNLNLYVWTNFDPRYSSGIAFAIAETLTQAKKLVSNIHDTENQNFTGEPEDEIEFHWGKVQIYSADKKIAFAKSGGE